MPSLKPKASEPVLAGMRASRQPAHRMHILLAASELHPWSKTGGLADAVAALGQALARAGCRVTMVTPLYRGIRARAEKLGGLVDAGWPFSVPLGATLMDGRFWKLQPEPNLEIWFVENDGYYDRAGIYNEAHLEYPDNAERFLFLSKAALLLARHLPDPPELIHAHDWQAGLIPLLVRHGSLQEGWVRAPKTIFTIHNLAYQGTFPLATWAQTNVPPAWLHLDSASHYNQVSFLKAGLTLADALSTVSPTYAREICTPEYGCGLDGLLRRRSHDLVGILNGVDYGEWNTTRNPALGAHFDADHLAGKALVKAALQKELGLPVRADLPLFTNITRLTDQKGADLLLEALIAELPGGRFQFALLGSGDAELEAEYRQLALDFPHQVAARIGFDPALAHRLEAAADFYVMPSRFEPCGLNQMYSLRYGAVPIVRATGGLQDSVVDPREDLELANGIKFHEASSTALAAALRKALALYAVPEGLAHFRANGMTADHSWDQAAIQYLAMYEDVLHGP